MYTQRWSSPAVPFYPVTKPRVEADQLCLGYVTRAGGVLKREVASCRSVLCIIDTVARCHDRRKLSIFRRLAEFQRYSQSCDTTPCP